MGANEWRSENEFPLARQRETKYYLHSANKGFESFDLTQPNPSETQTIDEEVAHAYEDDRRISGAARRG
jgi:predicted acyl esterase